MGNSPTLFFCDGANRVAIVTVFAVYRVDKVTVESEFVGAVGAGGVERTRPIEAVRTTNVEDVIVPIPRSREENGITIRTSDEVTANTRSFVITLP